MTRLLLVAAALAAAFLLGRRSLAAASVEDEMAVVQPADAFASIRAYPPHGCWRCGTNHDTAACPFGTYTN